MESEHNRIQALRERPCRVHHHVKCLDPVDWSWQHHEQADPGDPLFFNVRNIKTAWLDETCCTKDGLVLIISIVTVVNAELAVQHADSAQTENQVIATKRPAIFCNDAQRNDLLWHIACRGFLVRFGALSPLRYRSILAAFLVVTAVAVFGALQLRVDRSQVENFAAQEPIRIADETINRRFAGTAFLDVDNDAAVEALHRVLNSDLRTSHGRRLCDQQPLQRIEDGNRIGRRFHRHDSP